MRPDRGVLAAFGAHADPVPLPGGEGTTWRAGEVVLKPAGDPRVARWTAGLYRELGGRSDRGFRVPRPLGTATGDWVAGDPATGGWVAWQWLPGEPADWAGVSRFWPGLIAASRAFHAALAGRGPARPPSMSWTASRNGASCWPARWCTGSSPRSSSGAATRPLRTQLAVSRQLRRPASR